MQAAYSIPKWQKELQSFRGIKSLFILEGNIRDHYLLFETSPDGPAPLGFYPLPFVLEAIFNGRGANGRYDFMFCDPIFGFSDPLNQDIVPELVKLYEKLAETQRRETEAWKRGRPRGAEEDSARVSEIIRAALTMRPPQPAAPPRAAQTPQTPPMKPDPEKAAGPVKKSAAKNLETRREAAVKTETAPENSLAVVLHFASRLASAPDDLSPSETSLFLNLLYASENAIRIAGNIRTLILVADKCNDIPTWFYFNNPNVRTISIPNPDREARDFFVSGRFRDFDDRNEETRKRKEKFIDMTEGMKLLEIDELRRLYHSGGFSAADIGDTVSIYKFGFRENKWAAVKGRLGGDLKEAIQKRVKGQGPAVEKIARVVKRAVAGLSGMQHSSSGNKPRGILFLAGPTGTGKTEAAKTMAELLFGDETALIRFDMSE
jgi:SpoVK/Ycf46/Vps4 family AAA+-type ATPase